MEAVVHSPGGRVEQGLGMAVVRSGEMAVAGAAAKAKAMVEAKFVIALQRPRNIFDARSQILEACKRPKFAEVARYKKPVGGTHVCGPSIRFAETALQAMRNVDVTTTIVWEDEEKRSLNISVTDLETNNTYSEDITVSKTVERRVLKDGQTPLRERLNSKGEKVYLVAATEDDLANKVNAAKSKCIRNCGLRLIPQDIVDEAMEAVQATIRKGDNGDPKAQIKKLCDAFADLNITPRELEKYLGHAVATISPDELVDLREIYTAIKDGEASWADYNRPKKPVMPDNGASAAPAGGQSADSQGPAQTTQAAQTQADADLPDLDNPMEEIWRFIERDMVTEAQVMAFCKAKRMAKDAQTEIGHLAESKVADLLKTWPKIVEEIRSIKI